MQKIFFVYDAETKIVISDYEQDYENSFDGYNVFTRPYKYINARGHRNLLESIYYNAISSGILSLKLENIKVGMTDIPCELDYEWVENKDYFKYRNVAKGWWKLNSCNFKTV